MVETIDEFRDELGAIRDEMRQKGEKADARMVASWLDRLIIAMENLAPTLDMMGEGLDVVAEDEGCECECCMPGKGAPMKKKPAAKAKKAKRR